MTNCEKRINLKNALRAFFIVVLLLGITVLIGSYVQSLIVVVF